LALKTRIKEFRARNNLTQEGLARLVNARRETIIHLEKGKYNPSLRLAHDIARALKTTIEELFYFDENGGGDDRIQMKTLRRYGNAPFRTAVIHGGPGAPGEMAPVAQKLSSFEGVLEPLQTEKTIEGQIEELRNIMIGQGYAPVTLIGWSWGAWLSFIFAAQYPSAVRKLILVASGPFEERYARNIMKIRLKRLGEKDRAEVLLLMNLLEGSETQDRLPDKDEALMRLGKLLTKSDSFDPLPHRYRVLSCQYDVYQSIWKQASELRRAGGLLEFGKNIQCPVIAIHGDHDPHPAEGVDLPLSRTLGNFRFILLEKCGHTPWVEKHVKERFFDLLQSELD
jgi:pimeloyl-ACP methyl ester carboxylesterase